MQHLELLPMAKLILKQSVKAHEPLVFILPLFHHADCLIFFAENTAAHTCDTVMENSTSSCMGHGTEKSLRSTDWMSVKVKAETGKIFSSPPPLLRSMYSSHAHM